METLEHWKDLLNKDVKVIYDDKPSPYPKHKLGQLKEITITHLILLRDNKTEALRLTDIRRVEVVGDGND
jgi:ribosome maturation factor RimP